MTLVPFQGLFFFLCAQLQYGDGKDAVEVQMHCWRWALKRQVQTRTVPVLYVTAAVPCCNHISGRAKRATCYIAPGNAHVTSLKQQVIWQRSPNGGFENQQNPKKKRCKSLVVIPLAG
ncbi:hypothetical protein J3F83DRAFT_740536 [Trichoderma novae-zelandiae]